MANLLPEIRQTTFMGATIVSFQISISWNEQMSNLNITLVEDPVQQDDFILKESNVNNMDGQLLGRPFLFEFGGFSFTGLLMSFDEDRSVEEYPLYKVVLGSPNRILSAVQVGLEKYIGPANDSIFNTSPKNATFQVSNFLNVYGYAEDGGLAFGRSLLNEVGMPWNGDFGIRNCLTVLTNTPPPIGINNNNFFGSYIVYKNQYYKLDLSALPIPPDYYRVGGVVNMGLLELISRFCQDGGLDYIVNLTLGNGNGPHTISFLTVPRINQPQLDQITNFINSQDNISSITHGQEVRDDITQALLVGGSVQFLQPLLNSSSNANIIAPFFGFDPNGKPIIGSKVNGTMFADDDFAMNLNATPIADIMGELGFGLSYPCSILEMRCALANYETWLLYIAFNKPNLASTLRLYGSWDLGNRTLQFFEFAIDLIGDQPPFAAQLSENLSTSNHWPRIAQRLYEYIRQQADTYYGKQFLVQLPFDIKIKLTPNSTLVVMSDELSNAGYIPEGGQVLGLNYNNEVFFLNDVGLFYPFLRFQYTNTFGSIYTLTATNFVNQLPIPPRLVYANLALVNNINGIVQGGQFPPNPDLNEGANIQIYMQCDQGVPSPIADDNGLLSGGSAIFFVPLGEGGRSTPATVVTIQNAIWAQADDRTGYFPDLVTILQQLTQPFSPLDDQRFADFKRLMQTVNVPLMDIFIHPPAIYPDAVAVSLKSNQYLYGPWGKFNTNGKLEFEHDEGLTPWDCGDYTTMNNVANARLAQIATGNQVLERAQIVEAGIPSFNIGQTLFQDGPVINSISCNIGIDGIKTTYNLETFVNRVGAFSLGNAELLKKQGKNYQQLRRAIRQQIISNLDTKSVIQSNYKGFMFGTTYSLQEHTPHGMIGGYLAYSNGSNGYVPMVFTETNQESLKNIAITNEDVFPTAAAMGMEGLLRPYTTNVNNRNLPWYFNADPAVSGRVTRPITSKELNPFVSGCDINWILSGDEYLGMSNRLNQQNIDFNNLKVFSLRGPMLMQGWGYDIAGKPVPNQNTQDASIGTIYSLQTSNNNFSSGYLTDSINWPTGPVDLRWNKFTGSWISPGMIVCGMVSGTDIQPGGMGKMSIYVNGKEVNEILDVSNFYTDSNSVAGTGFKCQASFEHLANRWVLSSLACNRG